MARSVSESLLSTIVLHLATIPHRTYTPPPFHMLSHPAYNVSTRRTRMQLVGRRRPRCHCNCREHSLPVPPSVACHSLVAPAPERADRRRPDPKRTLRQGTNMDACSTRPPLSPCIVPWAPRHFLPGSSKRRATASQAEAVAHHLLRPHLRQTQGLLARRAPPPSQISGTQRGFPFDLGVISTRNSLHSKTESVAYC